MIRPGRPGDQFGFGVGSVRLRPAFPTSPPRRFGALRGLAILAGELFADGPGSVLRRVASTAPWILVFALVIPAVIESLRFRPDASDIQIVAFDAKSVPIAEDPIQEEPTAPGPRPEPVVAKVVKQPGPVPVGPPPVAPRETPKVQVAKKPAPAPPRPIVKGLPLLPVLVAQAKPAPSARKAPSRVVQPVPTRAKRPALRLASLAPLPSRPAVEPARSTRATRAEIASPVTTSRVTIDPLTSLASDSPAVPHSTRSRTRSEPLRSARSGADRTSRPTLHPVPIAASPAPAPLGTRGSSSRSRSSSRSSRAVARSVAPAPTTRTTARALALPTLRAPGSGPSAAVVARTSYRARDTVSAAQPSPRRNRGNDLAGVPLASLASCVSDREEDRLKQRIVAVTEDNTECVSPVGHYRFVQTRNLNAFLMWIERAPEHAAGDRCVELHRALDCLKQHGAKEA